MCLCVAVPGLGHEIGQDTLSQSRTFLLGNHLIIEPGNAPASKFGHCALTSPGRRSRSGATPVGKKRTRTPWQKLFQSRNRVASGSPSLLDHTVISLLYYQRFDANPPLPLFKDSRLLERLPTTQNG